MREEEAKLAGKKFRPAIEPPYRWRDWAAKPDGITGPSSSPSSTRTRPCGRTGSKGPGCLLTCGRFRVRTDDRRDVIARVFEGTVNRMMSGYLLRDVINKVNDIHFTSQDEIHTLGHLYETMLREMRDAAGDSGEFYTPRAGGEIHRRRDRPAAWEKRCSIPQRAPAGSWWRRSST